MPYVECPVCGLESYTAAAWGGTDHCPGCAGALPSRSASVTAVRRSSSEARMAQVESARVALQRLRERAREG
jgi:hypothetical protein